MVTAPAPVEPGDVLADAEDRISRDVIIHRSRTCANRAPPLAIVMTVGPAGSRGANAYDCSCARTRAHARAAERSTGSKVELVDISPRSDNDLTRPRNSVS